MRLCLQNATHTVKNYSAASEEGHASKTSFTVYRLLWPPTVLSFVPTLHSGLRIPTHREAFQQAAAFHPFTDP